MSYAERRSKLSVFAQLARGYRQRNTQLAVFFELESRMALKEAVRQAIRWRKGNGK